MMKVLAIGLIGLLGYSGIAQEKPHVFNAMEKAKYMVRGYIPKDYNRDGVYDFMFAGYDLNGNGKLDAIVSFKINNYSYKNGKEVYNIQKNAFMVAHDFDEDGKVDEYWFDKDGDGTLETRVESNGDKFKLRKV